MGVIADRVWLPNQPGADDMRGIKSRRRGVSILLIASPLLLVPSFVYYLNGGRGNNGVSHRHSLRASGLTILEPDTAVATAACCCLIKMMVSRRRHRVDFHHWAAAGVAAAAARGSGPVVFRLHHQRHARCSTSDEGVELPAGRCQPAAAAQVNDTLTSCRWPGRSASLRTGNFDVAVRTPLKTTNDDAGGAGGGGSGVDVVGEGGAPIVSARCDAT